MNTKILKTYSSADTPLKYSPLDGDRFSAQDIWTGAQYRRDIPNQVWYYNPWTGALRYPSDIQSDPFGRGMVPPEAGSWSATWQVGRVGGNSSQFLRHFTPDDVAKAKKDPMMAEAGKGAVAGQAQSALGVQIGGDHYKKLKIQPMEYSMANQLDACQHTIIKYVTRFRDKGGVQDLQKARHVLDMLIEFEAKNGK